MQCPLCAGDAPEHIHHHDDTTYGGRDYYYRCGRCALIFLDPAQHLSPAEEKERYDLHQNDPNDAGYVDFLNQLVEPLAALLPEGARGLDYGCGPGPTVSILLNQRGFSTDIYDPIYFPVQERLERQYDFVTCTETVEHFYAPREEWERFRRLVRPGGHLGIMTGMYRDIASFRTWWYHREPTHVNFYHARTWQWITEHGPWEVILGTERVVILTEKA